MIQRAIIFIMATRSVVPARSSHFSPGPVPAPAAKEPDGLLLELVATSAAAEVEPWSEGPVREEHAVRGLHGATIWQAADQGSGGFLTDTLGFAEAGEDGGLIRYQSPVANLGTSVYFRQAAGFWSGTTGVGTVHHMAFRAASDALQLEERSDIEAQGIGITPVIDRE